MRDSVNQAMKTTIEVKYINEPKSANGPGSVKTPDGTYYKVWPPRNGKPGIKLSEFRVGNAYEVEYKEEEYNGKAQRTVLQILGSASGNGAHSNGGSNGGSHVAFDVRSARIERQHSQEMALRYFALVGAPSDKAEVSAMTDWFHADIEGAVKELTVKELTAASAENDGGFEV